MSMSSDQPTPGNTGFYNGIWILLSAVTDGMPMPDDQIQNVRVDIMDGLESVWVRDQLIVKNIPFTIDLNVKPNQTTDFLPGGGQIRGICKIEGDLLTSCVAKVDQERPEKFESLPGSGFTLRVFRKQK